MAKNPTVDIRVADAAPSALNPLPVRLSDGASFYTASGGAGGGAISTAAKGTTAVGSPTSTDIDANRQALDVYVRGGGAGGGAVTVADGADVAEGATTDAVWVSGGNGSLIALSKYEAQKLEAIRALLAGSIAVTGTFWQATQPVSGPLTDTQLRATAVPVSGPLTDTQLRASAVPVSMATQTPDVTDRDARLLGRAKILDSAGAVIDPALKGQLPAALAAGGGLKVEGVAGGVAQPVSGTVTANAGTGPFPVSDNAGSLTVDAPVGTPAFVRLSDGAAAITTLPVSIAATQAVNEAQVGGTATDTNSGNKSAGTQRVVLATDQPALTNPLLTQAQVAASGGASIFHLVSAATTNATNLKASAGQVYGWYIYNSNAAARKVAFHNTAGTPTAGASIFFAIVIPPGSAANVFLDAGIAFATGIAITTVTDLTDAGTTAVALNDLIINIFFK